MPERPSKFPDVICWDRKSRPDVMNTIALDVRDYVFKATHYPSFLLQGIVTEVKKFVPGPPIREIDLLNDFLDERHPHVFDVAVGDSGTGKSHMIRWMYNEIAHSNKPEAPRWHVVLVPRSSSNLTDVIRRILVGFHGDIVARIYKELSQAHKITLEGAKTRVLDEFAFVLDPKNREDSFVEQDISEEKELVLGLLPALLRDNAIRQVLMNEKDGIVTRLAKHVFGKREKVEEEAPDLYWKAGDLEFSPIECEKAGQDAHELASTLMNDPEIRDITSECLNEVSKGVLNALLGLRRGDLSAAMQEIRKELLGRGQELILLIEDMSVMMGLDEDLIEALLVRTRDTGEQLCKLRSIIGLTHEDFGRLYDNIRGRVHQVVFFNMGLGDVDQESLDQHVGRDQILDFASRYLNATRYTLDELEKWAQKEGDEIPPPSYCTIVQCPNLAECHEAFGEVSGRGLYPLSREAVIRLYRNVGLFGVSGTGKTQAFNPRLLVSRVINEILEEAERTILKKQFPSARIIQVFNLREVGAEAQSDLRDKYPGQADQLRACLELYSNSPNNVNLPNGISEAFGLPSIDEKTEAKRKSERKRKEKGKTTGEKTGKDEGVAESLDEFSRWLNGEPLKDSDLSRWRSLVYNAIQSWIDWDTEGLAALKSRFMAKNINFEDQYPRDGLGDVTLKINRSPEVAFALCGIANRFRGSTEQESEKWLLYAGQCIQQWADQVRNQLKSLTDVTGTPSPIIITAQLLAFGALIRGTLKPDMTDAELLVHAMTPWPDSESGRSNAWNSIWKAYKKKTNSLRQKLIDMLVCSKGANIEESSMIDPSTILGALRYIQTAGVPDSLPPEAESWKEFQEVCDLAKEVQKHLKQALIEEKKACQDWTKEIRPLIDFSKDEDRSEVLKIVKAAFEEASSEGFLTGKKAVNLPDQLRQLEWDKLASCVDLTEQVAKSDGERKLIGVLSNLDRNFMETSLELLKDTYETLRDSTKEAKDRIKVLGGGGESYDEVKSEISNLLSRLKKDLEDFETGGANV